MHTTVCNQFSRGSKNETGNTFHHAPILPNDLDEYDLNSVYEVFRSLNIELQQQYEIVMKTVPYTETSDEYFENYIDQNYRSLTFVQGVVQMFSHISEKYVFQLLKSCCSKL